MKRISPVLITILIAVSFLTFCTPLQNEAVPPINFSPPAEYTTTIFDVDAPTNASNERLENTHPNIIFIMTDDQPYQTVEYMPTVKEELLAKGVSFQNGIITTPLCGPSRASILTGQYAHNHEIYTNRMPMGGAVKFDDTSTVATWLQDAGYETGFFGKYINSYDEVEPEGYVPPGWDEWHVFLQKNLTEEKAGLHFFFDYTLSENGEPVEYPKKQDSYGTDVITKKAVNFIGENSDEPFFMVVSYFAPHSPYIRAPRHEDTFRPSTGWEWNSYLSPAFNEDNIRDKPDYLETLYPYSGGEIEITVRQMLRSLLAVDDGVASILNALEKTGLNENTIIVYISDNSLTTGDHRFGFDKNCPYEACILTPFIVYAPDLYAPRLDTEHLVANIDLAPTFAELAGLESPSTVDGLSLVPLLENTSATWREEILIEHWPTEEGVGSIVPEFYAIRSTTWKYVEYITGEKELYDLVNDPYELNNLANKRNYRDIQTKLEEQLQILKQQ
ncbi:MAG: sulfatase [Anaerolineae bacterium]|jgi:N-acetylglucosamine-6-sulfatase|nr:sulfatase [Anaerolineae bacterium]MBT7069775.1 sulfatase [Anaerolineae bacterium]MBT7324203.1 sulfatase [Anaerolineae bacterium]